MIGFFVRIMINRVHSKLGCRSRGMKPLSSGSGRNETNGRLPTMARAVFSRMRVGSQLTIILDNAPFTVCLLIYKTENERILVGVL